MYAYVSRGLIRSEAVEGDSRARRYHAEDIQKLKERKENRKNPAAVVQNALHWGAPILETALTLISDGKLYYRGYNALTLAKTHTAEQVAALFWTGNLADAESMFAVRQPVEPYLEKVRRVGSQLLFAQKLHIVLTLASADDLAAYQLDAEHAAQAGARILRLMTAALADQDLETLTIAQTLQAAWYPTNAQVAILLNAALILCTDHELNASSFAARVVASAGAQPYIVVLGGLAALQGYKHGGITEQVEVLLREVEKPQRAPRIIAERLRRGEQLPGFGHKLYPDGDPRAALLLRLVAEALPDAPAVTLGQSLIDVVRETVNGSPTIDFALAILARALDLPDGAAFSLFALGRTIGWIAHAIEQYQNGELIRPRAAYIGMPPRD